MHGHSVVLFAHIFFLVFVVDFVVCNSHTSPNRITLFSPHFDSSGASAAPDYIARTHGAGYDLNTNKCSHSPFRRRKKDTKSAASLIITSAAAAGRGSAAGTAASFGAASVRSPSADRHLPGGGSAATAPACHSARSQSACCSPAAAGRTNCGRRSTRFVSLNHANSHCMHMLPAVAGFFSDQCRPTAEKII